MSHSLLKRLYPIAIAGGFSLLPLVAAAQGKLSNIAILLGDFLSILRVVLVVIFGIAIVVFSWGIVKYITAAGDPAKLKEARSFILWGIIMIFVLVAVFGLVEFIREAIGLEEAPATVRPPSLPSP